MATNYNITWDSTEELWRLPLIEVELGETFTISFPATSGSDPSRAETIIYMHPGITKEDVYYLDEFSDWKCEITVKKLPASKIPLKIDFGNSVYKYAIAPRNYRKLKTVTKADSITYSFAAIVDYNDTSTDRPRYVHNNSACKIEITY